MAGNLHSITGFTGQPLLINFWATWCTPCLREMPMFEAIWQERKSDRRLQIVGIAIDRAEDVVPYLDATGVTYPILVGQSEAMEVASSFGPEFAGLPFTVFVTANQQILLSHSGELLREQLDDILSVVDDVTLGRKSVADARAELNR
jgi:thiol-disulfide isomerase/thioredoxin